MSTPKKSANDVPRPKGLPPHLGVLCRMLRAPEEHRRCAAAMVLAELAPRETLVVEALGEALAEESTLLTNYALDALERIGSRAALPYLLPLLERDEQTRQRAQRAIAALGEPAIADVCRELAQAPRDRRRPLIHLLVDLDGKGALSAVVDSLLQEEPEVADGVVHRYHHRWASIAPDARAERREILLRFLDRPKVQGRSWPTALGLRLLGALGDPVARRSVLPFTKSKHPPMVRRAALLALRRLPPPQGKEDAAFAELGALLAERDFENVVAPALEALRALPTPKNGAGVLKQLLSNPHPSVRRFAVERLGDVEQADAVALLLKVLRGEEAPLREAAQDALRRSPAAPAGLARALRAAENADDAWTLARLVAARAADLTPAQARGIAEAAAAAAKNKDDARAEALLHALRAVDPERHRQVVLQRGLALLKQGKADEAARALSPLDRGAEADPEARYALAVALLKATPKDFNRRVRLGDRSLSLLRGLLSEPDFPLLTRLGADRSLSPDDLLYVGFHFAEGDEGEREFGCALLERLAKAAPRSRVGRSARNKLALARRQAAQGARD
jgi:HEAT repeat protein